MQRISLEIYTTAYEAIKILENVTDHKVEIELPVGSVLLDNILNLRLIVEVAKKVGKSVDFVTSDSFGQNLIKILRGENDQATADERVALGVVANGGVVDVAKSASNKPWLKLPNIKFPIPALGLLVGKAKLLLLITFILLLVGGFLYFYNTHAAKVVLYFRTENLAKSVQVRVGDGLKTDLDKKVLAGLKLTKTLEQSAEIASTGTKLEGEKAKGKVILYNSTEEEITLKKATQLTYKKDGISYNFFTDAEVKVPARVDSPPPDTTITKGTAEVNVTAEKIGESYNLKKEREISVKGYKSGQLAAINTEDFKGGSSKEVAVVTEADIKKLEQELTGLIDAKASEGFKDLVPAGYTLVDRSAKVTDKRILIDAKVGDEKTKLSGNISADLVGLTYSKNDLFDFIDKLSQSLAPPGFEFFSYNKDFQVEVLGETGNTVLNHTEADILVTFRVHIVPKIDKNLIFESIAGKSLTEAKEYLEKINGVEKVELAISHNLPLFNNIPRRESLVEIITKIVE